MPGTIQVSVLEFKGLPSASPPALLKVSLGKKEYQTSDMNGFSVPLTSLHNNLIVALQDAEGNELAHLGIPTMSIVERISWDDIFALDGDGYLHLRLQFILSQQDQNRIRAMREAAVKKKQGTIGRVEDSKIPASVSDSGTSSSQAEQVVSDSQTSKVLPVENLDVSVQTGSLSKPSIPRISQSDLTKEERSIPRIEIPKDTDNREGSGSDPSVQGVEVHDTKKIDVQSSLHCGPTKPVSCQETSFKPECPRSIAASSSVSLNSREGQVEKPKQQGPREIPVSKVKKIACAFESGLAQDMKYPLSISAVKSGQKKFAKGGHPKDYGLKDASEEQQSSSGLVTEDSKADSERTNNKVAAENYVGNVPSQATSRLNQSTSVVTKPRMDDLCTEERGMPTGVSDRSSRSETATISGRSLDYHFESVHSFGLSAKKQDSGYNSYSEDRERKDSCSSKFNPSNDESFTLEYRAEDLFLFDKSEAKSDHDKKSSNILGDPMEFAQHETDQEIEKDSKKPEDTRQARPDSPSNDALGGLVAQAIKIAAIVGFGVFVLLTRQREPRKNSSTSEDHGDEEVD